jgi:hypothetical protein
MNAGSTADWEVMIEDVTARDQGQPIRIGAIEGIDPKARVPASIGYVAVAAALLR